MIESIKVIKAYIKNRLDNLKSQKEDPENQERISAKIEILEEVLEIFKDVN